MSDLQAIARAATKDAEQPRRVRGAQSAFEPPNNGAAANVAKPDEMTPRALEVPVPSKRKLPEAIVVSDSIRWMEGDILCQFREDQIVSNSADIKRLLDRGANYRVIS